MSGHAVTMHETNTRGWIPLCACGWVGSVHPVAVAHPTKPGRLARAVELARGAAFAEHGRHVLAVTPGPEVLTDEMVARSNAYIRAVAPTVRRAGRFGNG